MSYVAANRQSIIDAAKAKQVALGSAVGQNLLSGLEYQTELTEGLNIQTILRSLENGYLSEDEEEPLLYCLIALSTEYTNSVKAPKVFDE